ncbi:MAG: VIT domain-containing protein [Bacteroidota bacterium]
MRSWIFCCLICFLACRSPKSAILSPALNQGTQAPFALLAKAPGDSLFQPLRISQFKAEVHVQGSFAQTTLDLHFYNEGDRQLAGTFYLSLLGGKTLDRLYLDLEGELRPASVVKRIKGRQAFEEVTRRRVDPALLEWSQTQAFQIRIFPIPAQGSRRIRLVYHESLSFNGRNWSYQLPLSFEQPVDSFELFAYGQTSFPPQINLLGDLRGSAPANSATVNYQRGRFSYGPIERNPLSGSSTFLLQTRPERNPSKRPELWTHTRETGETYVIARVSLPNASALKPAPKRLGILWDLSLSGQKRQVAKELELLEAYLNQWPEVQVEVFPFRHQALPTLSLLVKAGETRVLLDFLKQQTYDGATHLGSLDLRNSQCDEFLLFSDGQDTWQSQRLASVTAPIYPVCSSPTFNRLYLRLLSRQSGGQLIDLTRQDLSPLDWVQNTLMYPGQQLLSVDQRGIELTPLPSRFQDQVLLTGRMTEAQAQVRLQIQSENGPSSTITLDLNPSSAREESTLPYRVWAGKELDFLLAAPTQDPDQVTRFAMEHHLVSPYTSMLVLEDLEDYLTYQISPPEGPLRDEYLRAREEQIRGDEFSLFSHLDAVAEAFQERIDWWQRDFEVPDEPHEDEAEKREADGEDGSFSAEEAEPSQLADLAPPALAEESTDEEGDDRVQISLNEWRPDMPYQAALEQTTSGNFESAYFEQRKRYGQWPAFYADAAQVCFERKQWDLGLRILSNLAELDPDEFSLLRVLGYRLNQIDSLRLAEWVFRQVLQARPDEPQSHRDLGLCLAKQAKWGEAFTRLYEVVKEPWDERFDGIGVLVAHELNALYHQHQPQEDLSFIDPRLRADLPTDLRVVLAWDAAEVDLDLWVTDPRGEKCYYQNPLTTIGGLISDDFTDGYGPEEFLIKTAMPGTYQVQANYYANKQTSLTGAPTLELRLIRNYGRSNQSEELILLRLTQESEVIDIGSFEVE